MFPFVLPYPAGVSAGAFNLDQIEIFRLNVGGLPPKSVVPEL
jgi:hypothetical protein